MNHRAGIVGVVVVVGACVVPQQQQQPAAGAQQGQPVAAAGMNCPQVYDCYTRCQDQACINACEAGADPTVVTAARNFATCSVQNQCRDATCQTTTCGAQFTACQNAVAPATASAAGGAAAPALPAPGARTRLLMGMRQTGVGSSYTANVGWYVLFEDGKVLAHLPSEGLEGINESAHANDLGTYQTNGSSMEMAFQNYQLTFTPRADGGWDTREGSFWPVSSLDGATLDGAYAGRGPVEITFSPDGRFDSAGGVMVLTQNGLQSIPVGQGTYRVAQNTVTLAYASGVVARVSISTLKATELPRVSTLYLGGFAYNRR